MTHPEIQASMWRLLEERSPTLAEYAVMPSSTQFRGHDILIGIDGKKCRHVLIPVESGGMIVEDRESDGVEIVSHRLVEDQREYLFVDLACRKPHLHELFSVLADEVLTELKDARDSPDGVARSVLARWRELLHRVNPGHLGYEALMGLFGELFYLRKLTRLSPLAIDSWHGPSGHRHDFVTADKALEVKTTASRRGRTIRVHGPLQLETPAVGLLYLAFLRVESASQLGASVPELIDEIAQLSSRKVTLIDKLVRVGYNPSHADHYRTMRFSVLEDRLYEVSPSFPRITRESFSGGALPSGVIDLEYTIDLSSEPPVPLATSDEHRVLAALAGAEP